MKNYKAYNLNDRKELAKKYIKEAGVSMFEDNPKITYEWLLNDLVTPYVFCDSVLSVPFSDVIVENDIVYIRK